MSLNDKIFVLREDAEYPDGANVVEIIGTGDERGIPRYPNILIYPSPLEITSNGTDAVTVQITLHDYNSSTPFTGKDALEGETTAEENRFSFSVSDYIRTVSGVPQIQIWEDEGHTHEITDQIEAIQGRNIKLKDSFRSFYAGPDDPNGLFYQTVWYKIDTVNVFQISIGSQKENWWELNPDGTSKIVNPTDQGQVGGSFYFDSTCTTIIPDGEVPIPVTEGQTVDVTIYFRPERNSYGAALLNVAYSGGAETAEISVLSAIASSMDVEIQADPSSIAAGEKSLITAFFSQNGNIVNNLNVNYMVFGGAAYGFMSDALTITQEQPSQVDKIKSTEGYKLSVAHNIAKIINITLDPPDTSVWVFDPFAPHVINANNIELAESNRLPAPFTELNMAVTYDTGGYTSAVFNAPPSIPIVTGDESPEQISQVVLLYAGTSKTVDVTVTPPGKNKTNGLSIEANSPVLPDSSTIVTVSHSQGAAYNNRVVSLSYWPAGHGSGPATVTLGTKMINLEETQLEGFTVVTTEMPIDATYLPLVTYHDHATGQDIPLTVVGITGTNTIHLLSDPAPEAPVADMDVRVTYRAIAIADFVFYTPTTAQLDGNPTMNCYITAALTTGIVEELVTAKVVIDINAGSDLDLSLEPDQSSVPYEDEEVPPNIHFETLVTVSSSYYDEDTEAVATGNQVLLSMCPPCGTIPGSVVLGEMAMEETDVRPSSSTTINTKYIIKPGTIDDITIIVNWNSTPRTPLSIKGNEITINGEFQDPFPPCTITYTAAGVAQFTYNGTGAYKQALALDYVNANAEETDAVIYIGGRMTIPDVGRAIGNCEITLNDPNSLYNIEIEASESTIYKSSTSDTYSNSEWRLDDNQDEDVDGEKYPSASELVVTIMMGQALAPPGTEFTLYCFSQGKEPAEDTFDGSVKTGGVVAGSVMSIGEDSTCRMMVYANRKPLDTYTFKAVIGQQSADTSITVEPYPDDNYLTYSIPVATILGWRKAVYLQPRFPWNDGTYVPQGAYEFCSANAAIIGYGALKSADQYMGTDESPEGESALDLDDYILIEFHLPSWIDYYDLEEVSVSGATVLQPILRWGLDPGEISAGYGGSGNLGGHAELSPGVFGVRWNWEYNQSSFKLAVKDYMPEGSNSDAEGQGVYHANVYLGEFVVEGVEQLIRAFAMATTDADGIADFGYVEAGTYKVFIQSLNHKDNTDSASWRFNNEHITSVGVVDNIHSNDEVTVPPMTNRTYVLKDTEWKIEISATVKQRPKYDAIAVQAGWTPKDSDNIRIDTSRWGR